MIKYCLSDDENKKISNVIIFLKKLEGTPRITYLKNEPPKKFDT